jgi:type IV pilus assembly protein PilE
MSTSRGFTIIEIMIVVVMVAILASIAVPSYSQYVTRSKIQEATSTLLSQRVKMEQFFQDNRTYAGACAPGTVAPMPGGLKYFTINCAGLNAVGYTITATGGVAGGDTSMTGFSYSIDQGNNRLTVAVPAGWNAGPGNCWVTKPGGQC